MNPILNFILGGNLPEPEWLKLGKDITAYYKARIKFPVDFTFYHFNDDVAGMILSTQPKGPITLVGHSFGACKAVQTANELNAVRRKVDHLVLFDPVEISAYGVPNTKGFVIPDNVAEAVCHRRSPQGVPYSGQISSGKNYVNLSYNGDHGACVWVGANIAQIATALAGGNMLPTTVNEKKAVSVTLVFSDGSTQAMSQS